MKKALGSFSGMRKYLEKDMLSPSLQGRIRYGCTAYTGMDGCHIFEVCIDNKTAKRFSLETVNTYFIDNGFKSNKAPFGTEEYWQEFRQLLDEIPVNARTEYTDNEFCCALEAYRNQPIEESLYSDDPLERMFAVLDRRVGKRTLTKLSETNELQPMWLSEFYTLRLKAEQLI